MVAHVNGLYNMIYELPDWTIDQKLKEWEKVETNVSRQLTLRIISCIQIASKIHCYNEVIILFNNFFMLYNVIFLKSSIRFILFRLLIKICLN